MTANANNTATMDSIKKKMQAMKLEKENAVDRADQAEQRQKEFEEKLKTVRRTFDRIHRSSSLVFFLTLQSEEESATLQKRIQQIEAELDAATEQLGEANGKLETKEKAAADVRVVYYFLFPSCRVRLTISISGPQSAQATLSSPSPSSSLSLSVCFPPAVVVVVAFLLFAAIYSYSTLVVGNTILRLLSLSILRE